MAKRPSKRVSSASVAGVMYRGLTPVPVSIQITVEPGAAAVTIASAGPTDVAQARETRIRVLASLVPYGLDCSARVVLSKELDAAGHAALDLPIALGILEACGEIPKDSLDTVLALGELSLAGDVRPVRGAAVAAVFADQVPARVLVVPSENETEAAFFDVPVVPVGSLADAVEYFRDPRQVATGSLVPFEPCSGRTDISSDPGLPPEAIEAARRGQNLLLVGPPGAGKMMGARYLRSVLPPLTEEEAVDLTLIYSVAGLLQNNYVCERPFRAPHHSVSEAGLIGGGSLPRPGEVSLAHRGILLLDELPEFRKSSIDALAQVLRSQAAQFRDVRYPASPMVVVGTANPCPCGFAGTSRPCRCSDRSRASYDERLSDMAARLGMERVSLDPLRVADLLARARTSQVPNARRSYR